MPPLTPLQQVPADDREIKSPAVRGIHYGHRIVLREPNADEGSPWTSYAYAPTVSRHRDETPSLYASFNPLNAMPLAVSARAVPRWPFMGST
jgi:hypothetical protein